MKDLPKVFHNKVTKSFENNEMKCKLIECTHSELISAVKSKKATDFSLLYGIKPISDPYGGSDEDYRKTIYDLNFACELLIKELEKGHK